jgi:hypothetical protein
MEKDEGFKGGGDVGKNKTKKMVLLFEKVNVFVTWSVRSLQLGQNHQTA